MATRILFVDDEPDLELLIRQKFRRDMRSGAVEIEFASNGLEALEKIDAPGSEYDLVITDINMPQMDGLELLAVLSQREPSLVVVVLSAYGDMANIRTAMNRGAFDFLTKPIDFRDLEITLDKALRHLGSVRERLRLRRDEQRLEQRASFVRETFGRYLSDSVVQTLLDAPDGLRLGGEKRELSILMSDLRGFTSLCERLPAEEVVSLLNVYFGAMTEIVMSHGGTIDELLGDAMLVIFGAPLTQPDHADRAVACALAMQAAMEGVNRASASRGLPTLQMGIGIATGELIVGNIGSLRRSKYGVVGSHVNLTARIEGMTRGGQVLVSDGTLLRCSLPVESRSTLTFDAAGFTEPITVHELRGIVGGTMLPPATGAPRQGAPRADPEQRGAEAPGGPSPAAGSVDAQGHLGAIGLMVAGIAHDIRNPLGFIVNFADLSSELLDDVGHRVTERVEPELGQEIGCELGMVQANLVKIKEHGSRANALVRTMSETLRGTRGAPVDIDLNVAVSRHLELFESSLRAVEPELELELDSRLDETAGRLRIPPQDLGRILLNLVHNACDAARTKDPAARHGVVPRVTVTTAGREDAVELRVRDNGIGISSEVKRSMFDPFFTTKGPRGGWGLGLAFVREMVQALGGSIEVQTELGVFSELVVMLPRTLAGT